VHLAHYSFTATGFRVTPQSLDIAANRSRQRYPMAELFGRVFWGLASCIFRVTPRVCYGVRANLLRLFGATVGPHVHIHPTARIFLPWNLQIGEYSAIGDRAIIYNLGPITIGDRTTVSQNAHLCAGTHDYRDPAFLLIRAPITLGNDVWVCADAFIGPGVTVCDHAIVAARGVVVRDVEPGISVGGNPARLLKRREEPGLS
jgi:putative colanic acid biosynthesis acetyltransferase WcaF